MPLRNFNNLLKHFLMTTLLYVTATHVSASSQDTTAKSNYENKSYISCKQILFSIQRFRNEFAGC